MIMRVSTFLFAFTAPFLASGAAINRESESSLITRAASQQGQILTQVIENIKQHTATINATIDSINTDTTPVQIVIIENNILSEAAKIQSLLYTASSQIKPSTIAKRDSEFYNQVWAADETEGLLLEIYFTYLKVSTKLNLPLALGAFQPLIVAFKDLLVGVEETWPNSFWIFETWFLANRVRLGPFLHIFLEM